MLALPALALAEDVPAIGTKDNPVHVYEDAKEKMAQWIDFYNNERLHGALLYLTPADYFEGRKESRLAERREKLHTADINRKAYWLQQQ